MTVAMPVPDAAGVAGLTPLAPSRRLRTFWAGHIVSFILLCSIVYQLRGMSLASFLAAIPTNPWFLPALLAHYLALPITDWLIFRRLWRLPVSGFPIILGKRIANSLLLVYSGEVYFYLWARQRTGLATAPFGTIKDVNILSALAGNIMALLLLIVAWPWFVTLEMGRYAMPALMSAAVMIAISLGILLFRRIVFTLDRRDLAWIFGAHMVRLLAGVVLCAVLWRMALPNVPIGIWIALSMVRLLVGRLPLVPNSELIFVAIAVFLIGHDNQIAALVTMIGTAMLLLNLMVGALLALAALSLRHDVLAVFKKKAAL